MEVRPNLARSDAIPHYVFLLAQNRRNLDNLRSKTKDPWENAFFFVEQLEPGRRKEIWKNCSNALTRLDRNHSYTSLLPEERVYIARSIMEGHTLRSQVIRDLGISQGSIRHILKNLKPALLYHLPNNFSAQKDLILTGKEQVIYKRLKHLYQESETIKKTLQDPKIQELLRDLPHVRELFDIYIETSSIENFVGGSVTHDADGNKKERTIRNGNEAVRSFFFYKEGKHRNLLRGLLFLVKKGVFARWVYFRTNSSNENIDQTLMDALDILCHQHTDSSESFALRMFIDHVVRRSIPKIKLWEIPSEDILLEGLMGFALRILNGENPTDIAKSLGDQINYTEDIRKKWVIIGERVLENILTTPVEQIHEKNMFETKRPLVHKLYERVRNIIQEENTSL